MHSSATNVVLLEPYAGKLARTVLREERSREASDLLGGRVSMLRIELRQMFRTNGLIDDVVVWGTPSDYEHFSSQVIAAISSSNPLVLSSDSSIKIEIAKNNKTENLFTSLQNQSNEYYSMKDWNSRSILRISGSEAVLRELAKFLSELPNRGEGYSYISEFSDYCEYSDFSPEWRLHVEIA